MTNNNHSTVVRTTFWYKLFSVVQRIPKFYIALMLPLALAGYGFLLFFPIMFVISITQLIQLQTMTSVTEFTSQIITLLAWTGTAIVCAQTTRQIMRIRFQPPEGIIISESTALKLHELINQIKREITIPKIHRIIITEQLTLDMAKTSRFPFPLWSINTLVVGLPLMQCLSPEYFKCALARKLIQYSKLGHGLPKWMAQLRTIWFQYIKATPPKRSRYNLILHYFFKIYAPLYNFLTIPIANHVELLADQDTLRVINDEDLLQTIEKVIVTKIYLEKQYWPKINSMVNHNRFKLIEPYSKLEQVLRTGITPQMSKRWLDTLYCSHPTRMSPVPDLRSRMNNIGRSKIRIPEQINESAAHHFLDNAYRDIISEVNHMWLLRSSNNLYDKGRIFVSKPLQPSVVTSPAARMNTELFN